MGLKGELLYVQLEIKGQFWSNVVPHFSSASKIVLVNERSLLVDNIIERIIVNGITDHTVKIKSCDFHVITIEDKCVDLPME